MGQHDCLDVLSKIFLALDGEMSSEEEQAFLDGPCEELCAMLDDWEISHELGDMPQHAWQFIKKHKFFAMIIP